MDKFTFFIWKEKIKESIAGIFIVIVFIAIFSWFAFSTNEIEKSQIVQGTLVGHHQVHNNTGSGHPVFSIKLESGKVIKVPTFSNIPFKNGKIVKLNEKHMSSGSISYHFIGYAN